MYKKGITFGVFDIFHIGHLNYLEFASKHCDQLTVALRSDHLTTPGKKRSTYFNEDIRCKLINSLKCVHHAFIFNTSLDNPEYWLKWFINNGINIIIIGYEWKDSKRWIVLEPILSQHHIKIVYAPRTEGISSTMILNVGS